MRKFLIASVVAIAGVMPFAAAPASAAGVIIEYGAGPVYHHHRHLHWRHHDGDYRHHRHYVRSHRRSCYVKRVVRWHHHRRVVTETKTCR